jgi:large subunit ribosomal protein L6
MSRIGKKPILIPGEVKVEIKDQILKVIGKKGELKKEIPPDLKVEIKENQIFLSPLTQTKKVKALWGTFRALIFNMIEGVSKGFEKKLEVLGLGYRAFLEGENLVLQVGFTHPIKIEPPPGIKFSVEKNVITVWGIDKELVGQVAAKIRKVRPPEPYKGTGIRYLGERIRRKVGKRAVGIT